MSSGKKKIRIWRPHDSGFISDYKISTMESVLIKVPDSPANSPYTWWIKNYPDTCGRGND